MAAMPTWLSLLLGVLGGFSAAVGLARPLLARRQHQRLLRRGPDIVVNARYRAEVGEWRLIDIAITLENPSDRSMQVLFVTVSPANEPSVGANVALPGAGVGAGMAVPMTLEHNKPLAFNAGRALTDSTWGEVEAVQVNVTSRRGAVFLEDVTSGPIMLSVPRGE